MVRCRCILGQLAGLQFNDIQTGFRALCSVANFIIFMFILPDESLLVYQWASATNRIFTVQSRYDSWIFGADRRYILLSDLPMDKESKYSLESKGCHVRIVLW